LTDLSGAVDIDLVEGVDNVEVRLESKLDFGGLHLALGEDHLSDHSDELLKLGPIAARQGHSHVCFCDGRKVSTVIDVPSSLELGTLVTLAT